MKTRVKLIFALISLTLLLASLGSSGTALAATPVQNLSNGSGSPETDIQTIHIIGLLSRYRATQIGPGTREAIAIMIGLCDGGVLGNNNATLLVPVASASPQIAGGLAAIPCIPSPTTDGLRTGINSAILVFSGAGARYIRTVRMYMDDDGTLFDPYELMQQVTAQYNPGTGEAIDIFGRTQDQIITRITGTPATVPDGSLFPRLIFFTVDIGDDATSGHVDVAAGLGAGDDTAQGVNGICFVRFGVNCGSNFMKPGPETNSFDIVGGSAPPPSGGGGGPPPPPPPSGGGGTGGSFLAKAQALDVNHNDKIDDPEIVTASTDWTSGQMIAGTTYTISDSDIVALSTLWTTGGSISGGGGGSSGGGGPPPPPPPAIKGLRVRAVEAQTLSDGGLRLIARGENISGLGAQIFDLSGRVVFHQVTNGTTLTFSGLSAGGRPLANGVYLYIATVKGPDGQTFTTEVKKLVVLR